MTAPVDADKLSQHELVKKQALRLVNMVWSAVTKYLKSVVVGKQRPVEFPQLGIIVPMKTKEQKVLQAKRLT